MHLHIEPESVRQLASQFNQMANTLGQEVDRLNSSVNYLAANWNATGSTDFILAVQVLIHQIAAARDEADSLVCRIEKLVEAWETVDRQGVHRGEGDTDVFYHAPRQNARLNQSGTKTEHSDGETSSANSGLPTTGGEEEGNYSNEGYESETSESRPPKFQEDNPPRTTRAAAVAGTAIGGGIVGGKLTAPAAKSAPVRPTQADKSSSPTTSELPPPPLSTGGWIRDIEQLDQTNAAIAQLEQIPERGPLDDHQLRELKEQQQQLQTKFEMGIEANGRPQEANPFPEGECTWFATSKRDLYPAVYGHAKYWADQATQHGIEVGQIPIKGSVMVWQPGIFNADAKFGHVSFVEGVERLADGSFKIFYTDNLNPNSIQNIILAPDTAGVDFIY